MGKQFIFSAPSYVIFGEGARMQTGENMKKWAKSGVTMLICDETIIRLGMAVDVISSLEERGFEVAVFDKVLPEAPVEVVREGIAYAKEKSISGIVVIGGGSAIDIGKAVALMLENDGDIVDYCHTQESFKNRRRVPLFVLPTTCGTGSEMTDGGVIFDREAQYKWGFWDAFGGPDVAIIDVYMIKKMPKKLLATTSLDALAHAIECYTNRAPNPMSDALAHEAISLIVRNLPIAFADPENTEARENIFAASTMAGMAFNRTGIHVGHAAGQALGALAHLPHGLTCALFLPYVVQTQAPAIPDRICEIGHIMGVDIPENASGEQIGEIVANAIKRLNASMAIPSLKELGVDYNLFEQFAEYTINEPFQCSAPIPSTVENLRAYWDELFER